MGAASSVISDDVRENVLSCITILKTYESSERKNDDILNALDTLYEFLNDPTFPIDAICDPSLEFMITIKDILIDPIVDPSILTKLSMILLLLSAGLETATCLCSPDLGLIPIFITLLERKCVCDFNIRSALVLCFVKRELRPYLIKPEVQFMRYFKDEVKSLIERLKADDYVERAAIFSDLSYFIQEPSYAEELISPKHDFLSLLVKILKTEADFLAENQNVVVNEAVEGREHIELMNHILTSLTYITQLEIVALTLCKALNILPLFFLILSKRHEFAALVYQNFENFYIYEYLHPLFFRLDSETPFPYLSYIKEELIQFPNNCLAYRNLAIFISYLKNNSLSHFIRLEIPLMILKKFLTFPCDPFQWDYAPIDSIKLYLPNGWVTYFALDFCLALSSLPEGAKHLRQLLESIQLENPNNYPNYPTGNGIEFFRKLSKCALMEGIKSSLIITNISGNISNNLASYSHSPTNSSGINHQILSSSEYENFMKLFLDIFELSLNYTLTSPYLPFTDPIPPSPPIASNLQLKLDLLKRKWYIHGMLKLRTITFAIRNLIHQCDKYSEQFTMDGDIFLSMIPILFSLFQQIIRLYIDNAKTIQGYDDFLTRISYQIGGGSEDVESFENVIFILYDMFVINRNNFPIEKLSDLIELFKPTLKDLNQACRLRRFSSQVNEMIEQLFSRLS